jgi:UDP-N-acetylmuramoylalanine--D-glutamate ligase
VPIFGGRFKGGDIAVLRPAVASRAHAAVLIGEASDRFREALADVVPLVKAASLEDAVRKAWRLAQPAGIVLLSPACASFDMFEDYAARGRAFKAAVAELAAGHRKGRDR